MKTCFTVITNNYDELKPPRVVAHGWEYVCFSDKFLDVPPWNCIITTKPNREIKIKAEELFRNLALYVDGSIEIIGDLNEFIKEVPHKMTAWKHPHRKTVAEEAEAIIRIKGCDPVQVWSQFHRYNVYKDDMLAACGVLLRSLNSRNIRMINSFWYNEYVNGVKRDQLSFIYSCKKHGVTPHLFDNTVFNKYFYWCKHIKK